MNNCKVPIIFAYILSGYFIASVVYLIITFWIGSPFKNALKSYPKLEKIKKKSATKRTVIFVLGVAIACGMLWYTKPFNDCATLTDVTAD
jgi:hypothetical protein